MGRGESIGGTAGCAQLGGGGAEVVQKCLHEGISWRLEPQKVTLGLETDVSLTHNYSAQKLSNCKILSNPQNQFRHKYNTKHTYTQILYTNFRGNSQSSITLLGHAGIVDPSV